MSKIFAERLKELRGDENQTTFGEKLGMKQTTYSAWERNVNEPSYDTLKQIADLAHVSVDWLVGRTEDRRGVVVPEPDSATLIKIAKLEAEVERLTVENTQLRGEVSGLQFALGAMKK